MEVSVELKQEEIKIVNKLLNSCNEIELLKIKIKKSEKYIKLKMNERTKEDND